MITSSIFFHQQNATPIKGRTGPTIHSHPGPPLWSPTAYILSFNEPEIPKEVKIGYYLNRDGTIHLHALAVL